MVPSYKRTMLGRRETKEADLTLEASGTCLVEGSISGPFVPQIVCP